MKGPCGDRWNIGAVTTWEERCIGQRIRGNPEISKTTYIVCLLAPKVKGSLST